MFWKTNKRSTKFIRMIGYATLGSLFGLVLGFVLGFVIVEISHLVAPLAVAGSDDAGVPRAIGTFLGMGFGAIIGAIFGGSVGHKD